MPSLVVAGATGAMGRHVVVQAVRDPAIDRVVALSRSQIAEADYAQVFPGIAPEQAKLKLRCVAVDWEAEWRRDQDAAAAAPSPLDEAMRGHDFAAMCLGTTRKDAGSAEQFRHVDHDYPMTFVRRLCTQSAHTLRRYTQISSQGANANSFFLYMSVKGATDDAAVAALTKPPLPKLERVDIYRPGLLGRGDKARFVEKFARLFVSPMEGLTMGRSIIRGFTGAAEPATSAAGPSVRYLDNSAIRAQAGEPDGCCS